VIIPIFFVNKKSPYGLFLFTEKEGFEHCPVLTNPLGTDGLMELLWSSWDPICAEPKVQ